jgi:hypothetical protein
VSAATLALESTLRGWGRLNAGVARGVPRAFEHLHGALHIGRHVLGRPLDGRKVAAALKDLQRAARGEPVGGGRLGERQRPGDP